MLLRQNVKIIFCCYHVQIGLKMSQQTQSDIVHAKMLQNCGFRLHGQNACYVIFWNIAPKNWIHMDTGYCNSFSFTLWLYMYWEYVIECVFAVENMVDIKNLKNFIMQQFVDFKYRIWWYYDWIFFNPTHFFW